MSDTEVMVRLEISMLRDGKMATELRAHPDVSAAVAQTLALGMMQRAASLYGDERQDESGGGK